MRFKPILGILIRKTVNFVSVFNSTTIVDGHKLIILIHDVIKCHNKCFTTTNMKLFKKCILFFYKNTFWDVLNFDLSVKLVGFLPCSYNINMSFDYRDIYLCDCRHRRIRVVHI